MYLPLAEPAFDDFHFEIEIPFTNDENFSISEDELITLSSSVRSSSFKANNLNYSVCKNSERNHRYLQVCYTSLDEKSSSHDVTYQSKKRLLDFRANYEDDECSIIPLKMKKLSNKSKKSLDSTGDDELSLIVDIPWEETDSLDLGIKSSDINTEKTQNITVNMKSNLKESKPNML